MLSHITNKASSLQSDRATLYVTVLISVVLVLLISTPLRSLYSAITYYPVHSSNPTASKRHISPAYQASTITNSNLFGINSTSQSQLDRMTLPTTRLQLQLRGAFTSSKPELASAIIEGPDGETRSFKINNKMFGEVQLHAVYPERVVLSRNGVLESLYFPTPEQTSSHTAGAKQTINSVPSEIKTLVKDNMSLREMQQTAKQLSSKNMTPDQRRELINKRLQDLRNRARKNQ